MTTRLPKIRYLGDGCYGSHDGYQVILETCDGVTVTNRIGLDNDTLESLRQYADYAKGFYETGEHRVTPGCEECGKDLSNPLSPLKGPVLAEVYRISHNGNSHEIRLCQECARTADQEFLEAIMRKRAERP